MTDILRMIGELNNISNEINGKAQLMNTKFNAITTFMNQTGYERAARQAGGAHRGMTRRSIRKASRKGRKATRRH